MALYAVCRLVPAQEGEPPRVCNTELLSPLSQHPRGSLIKTSDNTQGPDDPLRHLPSCICLLCCRRSATHDTRIQLALDLSSSMNLGVLVLLARPDLAAWARMAIHTALIAQATRWLPKPTARLALAGLMQRGARIGVLRGGKTLHAEPLHILCVGVLLICLLLPNTPVLRRGPLGTGAGHPLLVRGGASAGRFGNGAGAGCFRETLAHGVGLADTLLHSVGLLLLDQNAQGLLDLLAPPRRTVGADVAMVAILAVLAAARLPEPAAGAAGTKAV